MPIAFQAEIEQIAVVLLLGVVLATLMLIVELRRPSKKRFALRLALNTIAILALVLLGLESMRLAPTSPKKIALFTDEVHSNLLDSLTQSNAFELFSLIPNSQTKHIQDVGILARNFPTSEIHLFGNGLNKADLTRLRGRQLFFHQLELPKGIVELSTPQSITLGEALQVKGLVRGKFNRLEFKANEMLIDSLSNLNEETPFEFSFTPKQSGKLMLSLALDGKEEKWGATVRSPEPLSILVLQSKPTFEVKYLQNFLAEKAYRFAMRVMVGKERYREAFLNLPSQSLAPLSRKLLSRFDLVMIDAETLASLTASERRTLENAVAQDGLGIFITELDSVLLRESSLKFFQPFRFRAHQAREQSVVGKAFKSSLISLDAATVVQDFGVQSLLEDSDGRSVAAFAQKGFGRIAISLVQNAYQWQLEGKREVYASYWAHLFSAIAKRANETAVSVPTISIVHEPIEFRVQTAIDSPRVLIQEHLQETPISLRQETLNPRAWRGRYWAKESGWIAFKINGEERAWAFVSDEPMFEALRKEARRKQTEEWLEQQGTASQSEAKIEQDSIVMLLCLLCFVLAMGGLWIERKL
ncbi:MAG: hypothetical protein SNJ66_03435 [Chloroherpetonaceae bacterium]